MPRPFKIWSRDRTVKKSLVVGSLKELVKEGIKKLLLEDAEPVIVVLEEDGTQVEDEDYFECLPSNTVFILLAGSDRWLSRKSTDSCDVTDSVQSDSHSDVTDSVQSNSREEELCKLLREDFHTIATFTENDLQTLLEMSESDLSRKLGKTEKFAGQVQDICQQYLDDRLQTREAADLLKLFHEAETSVGDGNKRQRTE